MWHTVVAWIGAQLRQRARQTEKTQPGLGGTRRWAQGGSAGHVLGLSDGAEPAHLGGGAAASPTETHLFLDWVP